MTKKAVREQEARVRDSRHSGLKETPANVTKDAPWANHKHVNPKHLEDDK